MTVLRRAVTVFTVLLLGLLAVLCGIFLCWEPWVTAVAVLGAVVVPVAVASATRGRAEAVPLGRTLEPDLPLPPVERQEERVTGVLLPSALPDYGFVLAATVRWLVPDAPPDGPPFRAASLAVDTVLERARAFASAQAPEQETLVQRRLDGVLGTMRPDASGRVLAMAKDVVLRLPDVDRERLARLAAIRKDEEIWEHARDYERNKRSYLGEDVLKDPGSAVVWWLARNEDETAGVDSAVDRIGTFARLSAAANNARVDPAFEDLMEPAVRTPPGPSAPHPLAGPPGTGAEGQPADEVLSTLGFPADATSRLLFARELGDLLAAHGRTDRADWLRSSLDEDPDPDDVPVPPEAWTPPVPSANSSNGAHPPPSAP